jgi:hypothetical protein
LGLLVGASVGLDVGVFVLALLGLFVGGSVGLGVRILHGLIVGLGVRLIAGLMDGILVGRLVGLRVGIPGVGQIETSPPTLTRTESATSLCGTEY